MKDYKKILEGVVSIINTAEKSDIGFANICSYIGENCPELKESGDERIRKALISVLKSDFEKDTTIYGISVGDIIAWLEKQGEKLNNVYDKELSEILCRVIRRYINDPNIPYTEREKVSMEIIPYVERLEKQGKQNPVIEMKTPEESLGVDSDTYNKIVDECVYGEQKSAWSEEDESHIRYLIECLEHCKKGVALTMTTSTSQEYINWLKSLKPQNIWKPSEEMLEALYRVIPENVMEKSENEMLLDKLYQGLKYGKVLIEK